MRLVAWLVVWVQVVLPVWPGMVALAAVPEEQLVPVAVPKVAVNRVVPVVRPLELGLRFSAEPTDGEIAGARVFERPIISLGKKGTAGENRDLAVALLAYRNRVEVDDASALEGFLQRHPDSPRRISLSGHLAGHYRQTAQFTKALEAWRQIWVEGREEKDREGRQVVDEAVGERASYLVTFGRTGDLRQLAEEVRGRAMHGASAVKLADALDALRQFESRPEQTYKCGPFCLYRMQAMLEPRRGMDPQILAEKATTNGTSLYQNLKLAEKIGLKCQMAKRTAGAAVPLPAMMHWKAWHFSALTKVVNGRYRVEDATFGQSWMSGPVLDEESSGYFLIPAGPLPAGWTAVTQAEGETIFGKGWPDTSDSRAGGGGCPPQSPPPAGGKECPCKGMAQYAFNPLRIGLEISDMPLGYRPPRGPEVNFKVTYSERTIYQTGPFSYANLGNQWTYEWLTYVKDNPTLPEADIQVVDSGGNGQTYTGYDTNSQTYAVGLYNQGQLSRTTTNSYRCVYPDGSQAIFGQPDNAGGPRRVFITRQVDPYGNGLDFTYDGSNRLAAVTDAIGQVTTVEYGLGSDVYKITRVTDPFGRYAVFQYNDGGQLTNITDEIGISSGFSYDSSMGGEADFINALTTPYGTTTFTNSGPLNDSVVGHWLMATDPLGGRERVEFSWASGVVADPTNLVPQGLNEDPGNDLGKRSSFYWNKKAMQEMGGTMDYGQARQYTWLGSQAARETSRTLGAIKEPMESARVWYGYPGQYDQIMGEAGFVEGTNSQPSIIARVLDDGTTQAQQYQYNSIGKPTVAVDPAGRTTYFTYATNNMDLVGVAQLVAGTTNVLAQYTYNGQHLPLTAVNAAGKTNFFGYNPNGQLTALTNALGQVVQLNYDTNGYLLQITGPLGLTNSFSYDGHGRVRTVTDAEGYTVTTSYDNLDRPTRVDYLDGSYEQMVYNHLDVSLMRDRNGHWTKQVHDPLRHLTDTYDSLGRHTKMDWCTCGALESITDPQGKVTAWVRDLQHRVTAKIYPDATQVSYQYETNGSRLLKVTDAKNQATCYRYNIDNNLNQVNYSNAVIATPGVSFTYDTNYNRRLTMVDGVGTNSYGYYPVAAGQLGAGQLAAVTNTFTGGIVSFSYDALGRITNRAINGVAEQLAYDALGRATLVTNVLGRFTNVYVRATALLATNLAPNGKKTVFSYLGVTNDQRLQTIWNQKTNSVTLSKFDYAYDALGQITNWTQQVDNTATNVSVIQYDPVNQLLAVTVHGNTAAGAILQQYAYAYDTSGNRTTEQIGTGTGGTPVAVSQAGHNANNQLTNRVGGTGQMLFAGSTSKPATVSAGGNAATINHQNTNFTATASVTSGTNTIPVIATDYSGNVATNKYQVVVTNNGVNKTLAYDLNGNETSVVTASSTNTYQWDAANRLVSITSPTNQSLFTYDGMGRRVQIIEKTNGVAVSTNKYLWTGLRLAEQRTTTGTVTRRFFAQGEQISGTNYYFTRDHLGSIREMVNGSGVIQARYDYDPYGRRTKVSGTLDADFGYTGHYYHAGSGLWLTLYRAYDPDLGRWLSRDPIEEDGGLNLYGYVGSNPVNKIDPYGEYAAVLPWFAGGGAGVAAAVAAAASAAAAAAVVGAGALGYEAGTWINDNTAVGSIGTAIGDLITPMSDFSKGRPRPKKCPPGTRPLDKHPDGSKVEPHKPDLGLGPKDWTGIDPDGNIGASDGDGNWEPLGHVDDLPNPK